MEKRQILIASDHAGFDLKEKIKKVLTEIEFVDLGPADTTSVDYPDFAKKLCKTLLEGKVKEGFLMCGSGQGMVMQANRFKGIRAALCWTPEVAKLSREHNNSNVLCLAGRLTPDDMNVEIAKTWANTPFLGGRHATRVDKID